MAGSGRPHESIGIDPLIEGIDADALWADKTFDSNAIRSELHRRRAKAVLPPKANRSDHIDCDYAMHRWRHLVENFFCFLSRFCRIATRHDGTDTSYCTMINLAVIVFALK